LDNTIKVQVRKQGIIINQNTYAGFDTEFNFLNLGKNNLISAQLAVTSRIQIKLPNNPKYSISTLDTKTTKIYKLKTESSQFNYWKVENTIRVLIQEVKGIKWGGEYDEAMFGLVECFKMVRGITYYVNDEYIVFNLPKSAIQPYIIFNNCISFKELVKAASSISAPNLSKTTDELLHLIKTICAQKINMGSGKEQMMERVYTFTENYSNFEQMGFFVFFFVFWKVRESWITFKKIQKEWGLIKRKGWVGYFYSCSR
jgi:hypothetical protein